MAGLNDVTDGSFEREVVESDLPVLVEFSTRYAVRSMPTVLLFSGGAVCGQLVGARPKSAFVELIGRA